MQRQKNYSVICFLLLITVIIIVEKNIKIAFKKSLSDWLTKWGRGGGGGEG